MNIVFDFAGVLFRWQPQALIERLLPQRATSPAEAQALMGEIFQGWRGDWLDFDLGTVEPQPLAQRISARTGIAVDDVRRVIDAVPGELQPDAATVALLRQLHATGRPLYFLSNMPEPYAQQLEREHSFLSLFRAGVFSARARLVKPGREIFDHAARVFGAPPASLFFLDDVAENVAGAQAAGWQALHFVDATQCRDELAARGLL